MKAVSSAKTFKFNGFVLALFRVLGLDQNLTFKNVQLCRLVAFSTKKLFLGQNWHFSQKVESSFEE